jgi:uncharacterized protein YoxC
MRMMLAMSLADWNTSAIVVFCIVLGIILKRLVSDLLDVRAVTHVIAESVGTAHPPSGLMARVARLERDEQEDHDHLQALQREVSQMRHFLRLTLGDSPELKKTIDEGLEDARARLKEQQQREQQTVEGNER